LQPTDGNRVLNTLSQEDLQKAQVGNKVAIFHDEKGKVTSWQGAYVVHSTDFDVSEKTEERSNWGMDISKDNFAQVFLKYF